MGARGTMGRAFSFPFPVSPARFRFPSPQLPRPLIPLSLFLIIPERRKRPLRRRDIIPKINVRMQLLGLIDLCGSVLVHFFAILHVKFYNLLLSGPWLFPEGDRLIEVWLHSVFSLNFLLGFPDTCPIHFQIIIIAARKRG